MERWWKQEHQRATGVGGWQEESRADTEFSKKLADVLRHRAVDIGLDMSREGYVRVEDLLQLDYFRDSRTTVEDLRRAVDGNRKQRFDMRENSRFGILEIRANQGHTGTVGAFIKDEKMLVEIPTAEELEQAGDICAHGTYFENWQRIQHEGLKTMGRAHMHFATRLPGSDELVSGMRSNSQVLIYLDVRLCLARGMKLHRSSNDVLLTRGFNGVIPPAFFQRVVSRDGTDLGFEQSSARGIILPEAMKQKSSLTDLRPSYLGPKAGARKSSKQEGVSKHEEAAVPLKARDRKLQECKPANATGLSDFFFRSKSYKKAQGKR